MQTEGGSKCCVSFCLKLSPRLLPHCGVAMSLLDVAMSRCTFIKFIKSNIYSN